jgi:hypothetical protein
MNNLRKIKFRVWIEALYPDETGMYYPDYVSWHSNKDGWIDKVYTPEFKFKEDTCKFTLLQYTGCKSKSGVEIYEGDIVKRWSVEKPEFSRVFAVMWQESVSGDGWNVGQPVTKNATEVIGNIYENPELLSHD